MHACHAHLLNVEVGSVNREIPNHLPCFGRAADLERLAARVRERGVTFVMAPPRMGKTWLVRNLAFEWAAREKWNVGYAQSSGGKNDLLREVVADLYKRWLDGANVVAQAKSLWQRHKNGLVGKVGGEVGKLLGKIATLAEGDWTGADKLIDQTFDALTRAEQDLRSGGLSLAPITYEDARDLVNVIFNVTTRPVLLVMDAWEQGLDLTGDQGSIRKLLDNEEDWPEALHLLVVIRDLPKHHEEVRFAEECRAHPSAGLFSVDRLDLNDLDEQERLLFFLQDKVPAVAGIEHAWVIEQCTNPAVIEWWIRRRPADREALDAEAANARNKQYLGLIDLIEQINEQGRLFDATVRLAMLPEMTSVAMWESYRELIDPDEPEAVVADLQSRRILDPDHPEFPSFGHTTAYSAVRFFLLSAPESRSEPDARPRVRGLLQGLIGRLAEQVRSINPEVVPFVAALAGTADTVVAVGLNDVWQWPARLARLLVGDRLNADERGKLLAATKSIDGAVSPLRALLAMGLFNTLNDAKAEEDLPRRDALLLELRQLAQAHPEDAAVRERLAKGLVNTLNDAKAEEDLPRRDALLLELRQLAQAHPEDAAVRERLAAGLVFAFSWFREEANEPEAATLLAELSELLARFGDDGRLDQLRGWLDGTDGN